LNTYNCIYYLIHIIVYITCIHYWILYLLSVFSIEYIYIYMRRQKSNVIFYWIEYWIYWILLNLLLNTIEYYWILLNIYIYICEGRKATWFFLPSHMWSLYIYIYIHIWWSVIRSTIYTDSTYVSLTIRSHCRKAMWSFLPSPWESDIQKHHIYRFNIRVTHKYEWGHDTFACYQYDIFVMFHAHVWMDMPHMKESCHICVLSHIYEIYISHTSLVHIYTCVHAHMKESSHVCVLPRLIRDTTRLIRDTTRLIRDKTRLIHE